MDRGDQRFITHWIDQHLNNVGFSYLSREEFEGNFSVICSISEWEIIESLLEVDNDKFVITIMTVVTDQKFIR